MIKYLLLLKYMMYIKSQSKYKKRGFSRRDSIQCNLLKHYYLFFWNISPRDIFCIIRQLLFISFIPSPFCTLSCLKLRASFSFRTSKHYLSVNHIALFRISCFMWLLCTYTYNKFVFLLYY
jgi:hypothetical protein